MCCIIAGRSAQQSLHFFGMTNEGFYPLSVRCRCESPPGTGGIENLSHDRCLVNLPEVQFLAFHVLEVLSVRRAVMHMH